MSGNTNLHKAKRIKNDEFYTKFTDIVKELEHYKKHFENKVVYCNCDNPVYSAFWRYFHLNFKELRLKKLISTHYEKDKSTYKMEYIGGYDNNVDEGTKTVLKGDGDFRSAECVKILKEADIVVTNCPFSLFREYVAQLMKYKKKFLIIGNMNAIKYKEIFPYMMADKMWMGVNNVHEFVQPDGSIKKFGNINWYTNLDVAKRHEKIKLWKHYSPEEYPTYETYDAIEVSKVTEIPCDYDGIMGVPISFMNKYSPDQFEIVGEFNHGSDSDFDLAKPVLNGKELYPRIAIRKRINIK